MEKVILFGASGKTGIAIMQVAARYDVNIVPFTERKPDIAMLKKVISGSAAVIIVFGPRAPFKDIFCEKTTKDIITAMYEEHVERLICQTGAMIGEFKSNRSFFFQMLSAQFKKSSPESYIDRVNQERAIRESELQWTIIKPPRLTDGVISNRICSGENITVGLMSSISRNNLAQFILGEVLSGKYLKKSVFVKNGN